MKELVRNYDELSPSERRKLIIHLGKQGFIEDDLVQISCKDILNKKGEKFLVNSGKKDRRTHKFGQCYANSARMMEKGYGYVEGIVTSREGQSIFHAWNVDADNEHWDFTFDNTQEMEYLGIIIPTNIVCKIGLENGGGWGPVLPFIEDEF